MQCLRMTPTELATTPLPMPDMTPPVTNTYFMAAEVNAVAEVTL